MARWLAIAITLLVSRAAAADVVFFGRMVDNHGEPAAGVTVVASGPAATGVQAVISDENGRFDLAFPAGKTLLTFYYMDVTIERSVEPPATGLFDVGVVKLPEAHEATIGCSFGPEYGTQITRAFAVDVGRRTWPVTRTRDTAAIVALTPGAFATVTRVDGGSRLAGAPPIALALIEGVRVSTMRDEDTLAGRAAGVDIDTRSGSNQLGGGARVAIGTDGNAFEGGAGGPIVKDKAWWWAGGVTGPDGAQALAKLNYAPEYSEQGRIVALHSEAPATAIAAGEAARPTFVGLAIARSATSLDVTDDWADALWESKLDDARLQLDGGATGERLVRDGIATTRGALRGEIVRRLKAAGSHEFHAGGEVGAGDAGDVAHHDATGWVDESWYVRPDLHLEGGLRWDERWFGADHASVWQPHATISYDWENEGAAEVFVTAARISLLDAGALGAWRTDPRVRDDVAAGVRHDVTADWVAGVAVRATDAVGPRHTGLDLSIGHRGHAVELQAGASSLERAVAGFAGIVIFDRTDRLVVGGSGRVAETDSEGGLSIGWRHGKSRSMTLAGELFDGTLGKTARAVLALAL